MTDILITPIGDVGDYSTNFMPVTSDAYAIAQPAAQVVTGTDPGHVHARLRFAQRRASRVPRAPQLKGTRNMSTTHAPIRVSVIGSSLEAAVVALLTEQESAQYELPAPIVDLAQRIETLCGMQDALVEARKAVDPDAQARARDSVLAALAASASRGEPVPDPSAPLRELAASFAAIEADRSLVDFAWLTASQELLEQIETRTGEIADVIGGALDDVLTAAAPHAERLGGFAFGDITALARADKRVQAAFAALEELVARHDAVRRAGFALYLLNNRRAAAELIAHRFAGGGIELREAIDRINDPAGDHLPQLVRRRFVDAAYSPSGGHAVERLATAARASRPAVAA